jgi:hypothetical protein
MLGWSLISRGNGRSTIVDPKNIFQLAMLANADAIYALIITLAKFLKP